MAKQIRTKEELEEFMKALSEEGVRLGCQAGARALRDDLKTGKKKMEELNERQRQILIDYPEEETNARR